MNDQKPQIIFHPNTLGDKGDDSSYEVKIPYTVTDAYGKTDIFHNRNDYGVAAYEAELDQNIADAQAIIDDNNAKKAELVEARKAAEVQTTDHVSSPDAESDITK